MTRTTAYFEGRVQGVGFRFTARQIARDYGVAGYVENLADGRVKCVAEGDSDQVESFVDAVGRAMAQNITNTQLDKGQATGEFGTPGPGAFGVKH